MTLLEAEEDKWHDLVRALLIHMEPMDSTTLGLQENRPLCGWLKMLQQGAEL